MANVYELEKKKRYYNNLKDNLNILVKYLNNAIDSLKPASDLIGSAYNVDGMSADNNRLINERENLIFRRDSLVNTVIPNIDYAIRKIRRNIEEENMKLTGM